MFRSTSRRLVALVPLMLVALVLASLRPTPARAADAPAGAAGELQEGLTPCLIVAADGSPVWPSTSLPPMKKLTMAFRLPADVNAKELKSRWFALGNEEQLIAENSLALQGQRAGVLRLVLRRPAPPGKYRLDTMLDDKPWKSAELTITPPITEGKADTPQELVPIVEGQKLDYDMVLSSGPGTTVEFPGVEAGADGVARAKLAMTVGKTEDAGALYTMSVNDKPVRDIVVKMDAKGLMAVKRREGDEMKEITPPEVVLPLPPTLEDGVEWTSPGRNGGEVKNKFFGPLPMRDPSGQPASGYLIFSDEAISAGEPGRPASRGRETVEQHYIPKVGLVKEVRVSMLDGRLASRQEITAAGAGAVAVGADAPPVVAGAGGASGTASAVEKTTATAPAAGAGGDMAYTIVADPKMKGRLGRIKFAYPKETKISEARVAVFKPGTKDQTNGGYGSQVYEMMPGKYDVTINNKRVPVEVKSAHETAPKVGVVRIHAGANTSFKVLDADKKTELHGGYGGGDIALPAGTYYVQIAGSEEPVKVEDGQVVEF
ncbi:MAG: hypothetical protein QOE14_86 [Humisphaera sp.]|nr:hypothetical protein [Humisphaera sp.]